MKVDFNDPTCHDKPLWVVYGVNCFPSIICCKLTLHHKDDVVIWGHSVYRRSPGFRTLGKSVITWINDYKQNFGYDLFEFYDSQDEALDRIRKLTTPGKQKFEGR